MKIFVCIKQVPDTDTKIRILADQTGIDPASVTKWVLNPFDEVAVEEAIKTRDKYPGSQVWVVCVGPKTRTVEAIRTALAMGADEGIAVNTAETLDAYATAKCLAACIKAEGDAKLIFTGKLAIDYNQSSVNQMLAEMLELPHANVISKAEYGGDSVKVEREIEGGAKEVIQTSTPAVLGANKGLNMPRFPSLPGIMKAKKKVIKELESSALGVSAGDIKVKFEKFRMPPEKPATKMLAGDSTQQASDLVRLLRDEAKVL